MRTITKDVFKFDELSEAAKDEARAWYREGSDFDADAVIEDFKTIIGLMGFYDINVMYSGFSSQGDGACFTGRYAYAKGATQAVKEYAPLDAELLRIAKSLQAAQRAAFYKLNARISHSGNYYHENSINVETCDERDEYRACYDLTDEVRHLSQWLYARLEAEYDYQNADSTVDENITCNDYEFYADGSIA